MNTKKIIIAALISAAVFFCGAVVAENGDNNDNNNGIDPIELLYKSREMFKSVDDYTAVFVKEELIDGKMKKPETIFLKFKRPFSIYMKWFREPNKGRELIYVKGKNNGNLKVHIGGFFNLFLPAINIHPESPHVLRNTRHPITRAGFENMINSLIEQFELAKNRGHLETVYHGIEKLNGVDTYKFERILPKDKGYYCYRLILNIDKESGVPVKVQVYNWDNECVERYAYSKVTLNAGLTEEDFDPRNKKYGFGIF